MKKTNFILLLFLPLAWLQAQPCPTGFYDLHHNRIQARLNAGGDLFTDFENGVFLPDPVPGHSNPWTIYAANLWVGGIDPGGNAKVFSPTYNMSGAASAGPADFSSGTPVAANCEDWDRLFSVKGADIAAFLADIPADLNAAIDLYPGILGWPGRGNPHFEAVNGFPLTDHIAGLAPFYDVNGDGLYNPMDGDYPAVVVRFLDPFVAGEMVWGAFNNLDQSNGIPIEVHVTAWAFDCEGLDALNNTVFTSHKVVYHGTEALDSAYLGMWIDFDIGCYVDDYLGTAPDLHSVFAYNRDLEDGDVGTSCSGGIPSFGENAPVQSATFLGTPLDKAIYYNNPSTNNPPLGTTDPAALVEYYRVLSGSWRDGTPLTYGGSGYNPGNPTLADHFCPDDPANPEGWSMCASFLPENDRRVVASSLAGALLPGAVNELVTAWTHHPDPNLPCGLGDTYTEIEEIRAFYDNNFEDACLLLSAAAKETGKTSFSLYPNPATGAVAIDAADLEVLEIAVVRTDGALVFSGKAAPSLDVSGWNPGLYLVQLKTGAGWITEKLVVR